MEFQTLVVVKLQLDVAKTFLAMTAEYVGCMENTLNI